MHLDGEINLVLHQFGPPSVWSEDQIAYPCEIQACQNVYRQEEEPEEAGGEDLCHPSGYNKETGSAVSLIIIHVIIINLCYLK